MTYPNEPAIGKTDTSAEAADAIRPHVSQLKAMIIDALALGVPMTSYELAVTLREDYENIQPRCSELQAMGVIRDSGKRGPSRHPKRTAIKWEIAL